jgi:hypothetical protein
MDRRLAFALLKRLLPPFVSIEINDLVEVTRSALRLAHVHLSLNGYGRATIRGLCVELFTSRVSCDRVDVVLELQNAAPPKDARTVAAIESREDPAATDSVTAAAVSSLLKWLFELGSNSAFEVTECYAVIRMGPLRRGLGVRAQGILLHVIPTVDREVSGELSVATLDAFTLSAESAADESFLAGTQLPEFSDSNRVASVTRVHVTVTNSLPASAAFRIGVDSCVITLSLQSLASMSTMLAASKSNAPIGETAAASAPSILHSESGGLSAATALGQARSDDVSSPVSDDAKLSSVARNAREGGFFGALRDVVSAAWRGADSVREHLPRDHPHDAPISSPTSDLSSTFLRLGVSDVAVDDTDFQELAGSGAADSASSDFLYRSVMSPVVTPRGSDASARGPDFADSNKSSPKFHQAKLAVAADSRFDFVVKHAVLLLNGAENSSLVEVSLSSCRGDWCSAPEPPLSSRRGNLEWDDLQLRLVESQFSDATSMRSSDVLIACLRHGSVTACEFSAGRSLGLAVSVLEASAVLQLDLLAAWIKRASPIIRQLLPAFEGPAPAPASRFSSRVDAYVQLQSFAVNTVTLSVKVAFDDAPLVTHPRDLMATAELTLHLGAVSGLLRSVSTSSAINKAIAVVLWPISLSAERLSAVLTGRSSIGGMLGSPLPVLTVAPLGSRNVVVDSYFHSDIGDSNACVLGDLQISLSWSACSLIQIAAPSALFDLLRVVDTAALFAASPLPLGPLSPAERPGAFVFVSPYNSIHIALPTPTSSGFIAMELTLHALQANLSNSGIQAYLGTMDISLRKADEVRLTAAFVVPLRDVATTLACPFLKRGGFTAASSTSSEEGCEPYAAVLESRVVSSAKMLDVAVSDFVVTRAVDIVEWAVVFSNSFEKRQLAATREAMSSRATEESRPLLLKLSVARFCVSQTDVQNDASNAAGTPVQVPVMSLLSLALHSTQGIDVRVLQWALEGDLAHLTLHLSSDLALARGRVESGPPIVAFNDMALLYCVAADPEVRPNNVTAVHVSQARVALLSALSNLVSAYDSFLSWISRLDAVLSSTTSSVPSTDTSTSSPVASDIEEEYADTLYTCAPTVMIPMRRFDVREFAWTVPSTHCCPLADSSALPGGSSSPPKSAVDCESRSLAQLAVLSAYRDALDRGAWGPSFHSHVEALCGDSVFDALLPTPDVCSAEEWLPGCSAESSSPFEARSVLLASLSNFSVMLSETLHHPGLSEYDTLRNFEGMELSISDVACLAADHAQGAGRSVDNSHGLFGWSLVKRAGFTADSVRLTDSLLGSHNAPQTMPFGGGGTTVNLFSKAAEGMQQPSLRCMMQWVVPLRAGGGNACDLPGSTELRAWIDVAPQDLCIRGRTLLFFEHFMEGIPPSLYQDRAPMTPAQRQEYPGHASRLIQLISIGDLRLTVSFLPETGMASFSLRSPWGGTSGADAPMIATFPLLPIDRLTLRLRSVSALHASNSAAVVEQLSSAYMVQLQQQDGVRQVFVNVPAAVMPRAHAVLEWLKAVAAAAFTAVGGTLSNSSGSESLAESARQVLGSFIATSTPIAATVAARLSAGGRALFSALSSSSQASAGTAELAVSVSGPLASDWQLYSPEYPEGLNHTSGGTSLARRGPSCGDTPAASTVAETEWEEM